MQICGRMPFRSWAGQGATSLHLKPNPMLHLNGPSRNLDLTPPPMQLFLSFSFFFPHTHSPLPDNLILVVTARNKKTTKKQKGLPHMMGKREKNDNTAYLSTFECIISFLCLSFSLPSPSEIWFAMFSLRSGEMNVNLHKSEDQIHAGFQMVSFIFLHFGSSWNGYKTRVVMFFCHLFLFNKPNTRLLEIEQSYTFVACRLSDYLCFMLHLNFFPFQYSIHLLWGPPYLKWVNTAVISSHF